MIVRTIAIDSDKNWVVDCVVDTQKLIETDKNE